MRNIAIPLLINSHSIIESIISLTIISISFGVLSLCISQLFSSELPNESTKIQNQTSILLVKDFGEKPIYNFTEHSFEWENGELTFYKIELE